jgi:hypothetical protein
VAIEFNYVIIGRQQTRDLHRAVTDRLVVVAADMEWCRILVGVKVSDARVKFIPAVYVRLPLSRGSAVYDPS